MKAILAILRTSAFWAAVAEGLVQALHEPVPHEVKVVGWLYVGLRVVSYAVKYIFPNPDDPNGAWFRSDSKMVANAPPAATQGDGK